MKLRRTKKGFTIVELVIVIAVIAVLSAVLIPTFISLNNKANKAADQSLIKNLDTALATKAAEEGRNNTMYDALKDAEEAGYKIENLKSKEGKNLVWNQESDRFEIVSGSQANYKLWKVYKNVSDWKSAEPFSIYLNNASANTDVAVTVGFDAGDNTSIPTVSYTGSASQEVIIRTKGDQCELTVNAPHDDVSYYGFSKSINVVAVADNSMHIYGSTNKLTVTAGHVQVEDTGIVFELADNTGSVTNNGYIGEQTSGTPVEGTAAGGNYAITSLARLEAFRDAVNSGNEFENKIVELKSNITLRNGWTPIGEGTRQVVESGSTLQGTLFKGTFDGQDHTITNLNNNGFVPTANRYDSDNKIAYGLFALVGSDAIIKNLTLDKVAIDLNIGDSVGAVVGFSAGSLTVENVTVKGSLKADDAVAGIVGRTYASENMGEGKTFNVTIKNCNNYATVESSNKDAGILAIVSDISKAPYNGKINLRIENCVNHGNVKTGQVSGKSFAAGILAYVTNIRSGVSNYLITGCSNNGTIEGLNHADIVATGSDKITIQ